MKGLTKSTFNFPNLQNIHKKTPLRKLGANRVLQVDSGLYAYSVGGLWIWNPISGDWEPTPWPDDVILVDEQLVEPNVPIKVDVYRNLHKGCYSVRSRQPDDSYGRVLFHLDRVLVWDAKFVVNEKGRQKVIKTKRKNVHAFVRGTYVTGKEIPRGLDPVGDITYNPYMNDTFVMKKKTDDMFDGAVWEAEIVELTKEKVTTYGRVVYT